MSTVDFDARDGRNRATRELNTVRELDAHSIVVHSHLKWDWVWQCPQQFLSRLSRQHRVLFVEARDFVEDADVTHADLREVSDCPNVNVSTLKRVNVTVGV